MVMGYQEVVKRYGSVYHINKAIGESKLFKIGRGIYSESSTSSEIEIISARYPQAIFTMDSAFYFHGLTDVIPTMLHLATRRNMLRIRNPRVRQYFEQEQSFGVGKINLSFNGISVPTYDKERMLLELVRRQTELPFDYYKEIIRNYRQQAESLDMEKLETYMEQIDRRMNYYRILQKEVF